MLHRARQNPDVHEYPGSSRMGSQIQQPRNVVRQTLGPLRYYEDPKSNSVTTLADTTAASKDVLSKTI